MGDAETKAMNAALRDANRDLLVRAENAERERDDARRDLEERRARCNELWRQTLQAVEQAKKPGTPEEVAALRRLAQIAAEAATVYSDWIGHASTRSAADDSMYRLARALDAAGFPYQGDKALNWRGSLVKELNDAGFFHSDEKNAFVYDPDAEKARPYRNHGNARGPTVKEIVALAASLAPQPVDPEATLYWCPKCKAIVESGPGALLEPSCCGEKIPPIPREASRG